MNRERRRQIARIRTELERILEDEEEAFESLPESVQESGRGDRMREVIDFLHEAVETLEDLLNA